MATKLIFGSQQKTFVWPQCCACCGQPTPSHAKYSSSLHHSSITGGFWEVRTFEVPYCSPCLHHSRYWGDRLFLVIIGTPVLAFLMLLCGAHGGFFDRLGLEFDRALVVTVSLSVFVGLCFALGFRRAAARLMGPRCAAVGSALKYRFDHNASILKFQGDEYGDDFAAANREAVHFPEKGGTRR